MNKLYEVNTNGKIIITDVTYQEADDLLFLICSELGIECYNIVSLDNAYLGQVAGYITYELQDWVKITKLCEEIAKKCTVKIDILYWYINDSMLVNHYMTCNVDETMDIDYGYEDIDCTAINIIDNNIETEVIDHTTPNELLDEIQYIWTETKDEYIEVPLEKFRYEREYMEKAVPIEFIQLLHDGNKAVKMIQDTPCIIILSDYTDTFAVIEWYLEQLLEKYLTDTERYN